MAAEKPEFAEFFQRLGIASARALLLDYDGTLAPFCVRPKEAVPYPGVREILDHIMEGSHTRLVIVSGRWTKDLIPLLGLKRLPEIWGSHGWEQLKPDGEYVTAPMDTAALQQLVKADEWTNEIETLGGRCEFKPAGIAIHWRGLTTNQIAEIRQMIFENWRMQELHKGLVWHDFDGGIELRIPGRNKGYAVDTVLSEMGADVAAAYLGDDLTDEDAFKAIHGHGIGVLVRNEYRQTEADFWIRPPQELLAFLRQWRDACEGKS